MEDWTEDRSSVFQDKNGDFSISHTIDNFRRNSSALVVMTVFVWGVVSAVEAWGVFFGLFFGTLVSGAIAFGLFALVVHQEWAQWLSFVIVALAIQLLGLPLIFS